MKHNETFIIPFYWTIIHPELFSIQGLPAVPNAGREQEQEQEQVQDL